MSDASGTANPCEDSQYTSWAGISRWKIFAALVYFGLSVILGAVDVFVITDQRVTDLDILTIVMIVGMLYMSYHLGHYLDEVTT